MAIDPRTTTRTYEPMPLRSHVAAILSAMSLVLAVGTWLSYLLVRDCTTDGGLDTSCEPVPPAVGMLVGLGITGAGALLLAALLLIAPLRRRVR